MKLHLTLAVLLATLALLLSTVANAQIGDFLVDTNQVGYAGTVTNITKDLDAVAFPTPRDAVVYFTNNVPLAGYAEWGSYNQILSNWYQHSTSNQNPGFFQMSDGDNDKAEPGEPFSTIDTATSAIGGWTQNGDLWDFTLTVTGIDATHPETGSRLWQPDAEHAWGGTFTQYSYTVTATGMETTVAADGWRYNSSNPASITGSFDGVFVSTQLAFHGPMVDPGDIYVVHLDLNKDYWNGDNWSDTYGGYEYGTYSSFGAPVPEPATMCLLGLGAAALLKRGRRA